MSTIHHTTVFVYYDIYDIPRYANEATVNGYCGFGKYYLASVNNKEASITPTVTTMTDARKGCVD